MHPAGLTTVSHGMQGRDVLQAFGLGQQQLTHSLAVFFFYSSISFFHETRHLGTATTELVRWFNVLNVFIFVLLNSKIVFYSCTWPEPVYQGGQHKN